MISSLNRRTDWQLNVCGEVWVMVSIKLIWMFSKAHTWGFPSRQINLDG